MRPFKARVFALLLILVSLGRIYYNWHQLLEEGRYSLKLAAFARRLPMRNALACRENHQLSANGASSFRQTGDGTSAT